jgi:hypothetical protein
VDEPALVRGVQCVGDVGDDLDRALDGQRAQVAEQLLEVGPVDPQHREVEVAVVLARLVDGDDAGMVDASHQLRLAQETLAVLVVEGADGRDDLERGRLAGLGVRGAIHHAHPSGTRNTFDAVPAENRSHSEHPGTSRRRARLASKLDSVAGTRPVGLPWLQVAISGDGGSIAGTAATW